jgi:hypothetical protein
MENTQEMVDKKWCPSCQVARPASDFKLVKSNKTSRWKCGVCLNRESDQKYRSKNGK